MTAKTLLLACCALAVSGCSEQRPGDAQTAGDNAPDFGGEQAKEQSEWRELFDGETLTGWRGYKMDSAPSGWTVEDGVLCVCEPGGGDIVTIGTFSEFDLEFEWAVSEGGNSGVFYFVNETEDASHTYETGPEYQILDDDGHKDGQRADHRSGSLYDMVAPSFGNALPVGEFNHGRIVVQDGRIEHWLNGEKIVESPFNNDEWRDMVAGSKFVSMPEFGTFSSGHIALQDHGYKVWFRNIRIREL